MQALVDTLIRRWRRAADRLLQTSPIYVTVCLLRRAQEDNVFNLAAALAYHFLFALFPMLIMAVALLRSLQQALGLQGVMAQLRAVVLSAFPPEVAILVLPYFTAPPAASQAGIISVGILGALWGASRGVSTLMDVLNRAYRVKERRAFWKVNVIALLATLAAPLLLFCAFVLSVFGGRFGQWALDLLGVRLDVLLAWGIVHQGAVALLVCLTFLLTYAILPDIPLELRRAIPGTLLASGGWLVLTFGFSVYVGHFGSYDVVYGSLSSVILLMLYLYCLCVIVLLGGELNALLTSTSKGAAGANP
jgi:membrane protein